MSSLVSTSDLAGSPGKWIMIPPPRWGVDYNLPPRWGVDYDLPPKVGSGL